MDLMGPLEDGLLKHVSASLFTVGMSVCHEVAVLTNIRHEIFISINRK